MVDNLDLLPGAARVLDVACGRGRHALFMAGAGFGVDAIDRDSEAIAEVQEQARQRGLVVNAAVVDLETHPPPSLGDGRYDCVLVFNYLHRPLFPALRRAVKRGGLIVYETFTVRQAERGHPQNPDFLLRDGELIQLLEAFTIVRSREGEYDGRFVASAVARGPK